MKLKTAIEVLDHHQEWRLGRREDMVNESKELTEAVDMGLNQVKKTLPKTASRNVELCENHHCEDGIVDKDYYGNPIYCQMCDSHD